MAEFGKAVPATSGPRLAIAMATQQWTAGALSLLIATAELYEEEETHDQLRLQTVEAQTRRTTRKH